MQPLLSCDGFVAVAIQSQNAPCGWSAANCGLPGLDIAEKTRLKHPPSFLIHISAFQICRIPLRCVHISTLIAKSLNRCATDLRAYKKFTSEHLAFSSKIHALDKPNAYLGRAECSSKTCPIILAFCSRFSGRTSQASYRDRLCACYANRFPKTTAHKQD